MSEVPLYSSLGDRLRVGSGRVAARAENAQGIPTQSHMSPSILVYEAKRVSLERCLFWERASLLTDMYSRETFILERFLFVRQVYLRALDFWDIFPVE